MVLGDDAQDDVRYYLYLKNTDGENETVTPVASLNKLTESNIPLNLVVRKNTKATFTMSGGSGSISILGYTIENHRDPSVHSDLSFFDQCLLNNRIWVEHQMEIDSNYFKRLSVIQTPKVLWIGCADSRIPPTEVTGTRPGDIFVHRNVANLVVHSDMNVMSVIQYAVENLQVEDIIVCGHYHCGGIHHANSRHFSGLINKWLLHVKDVYDKYSKELDLIEDLQLREDRLTELNVIEQCSHVCQTDIVQKVWKNKPRVHGWVYDVRTGFIKDLKLEHSIHDIYKLDL